MRERERSKAFTPSASVVTSPPPLVARLQDGLSSALPRRRVQGDAALLAVQPRGTAQILRAAAGPGCHQEEVTPPLSCRL